MAINKILHGGEDLILDLSNDTIDESVVKEGVTFHKSNGEVAQGTFKAQTLVLQDSGTFHAQDNCYIDLVSVDIPESFWRKHLKGSNSISILTEDMINGASKIRDYCFCQDDTLTEIHLPKSVNTIASHAFYGCSNLTSVELYDSVSSIDKYAFSSCSALSDVKINISDILGWINTSSRATIMSNISGKKHLYVDNELVTQIDIPATAWVSKVANYAFSGCSDITAVSVGKTSFNLGSYSFSSCSSLASADLSSGTDLNEGTFQDCSALASINIPSSNSNIPKNCFYGCTNLATVTIPQSVKSIKEAAFRNCESLTSIELSDNITTIEEYAFAGTGIQSIQLPNSLTTLPDHVFSYCEQLTNIDFPENLTSIGYECFYGCNNLGPVLTIPNSVTKIDMSAFSGASGFEEITIPFVGDEVMTSEEKHQVPFGYIFGKVYHGDAFEATKQYYYGSSLTSVTNETYYLPKALKKVTITGGNILRGAFYGCKHLTDIVLPPNLSTIEQYAFYNCSALARITIPASVTSIKASAFSGATSLSDVYYGGSEEQWNAITIDTNNTPLASATIHYNSVPEVEE